MPLNLADKSFSMATQNLLDLETTRIAAKHRLDILTKPANQTDKDGIARGFGLPNEHPSVVAAQQTYDGLVALEHEALKTTEAQFKKANALAPFVAATPGLGIKGIVRLLGVIGDPYLHPTVYHVDRDPDTKKAISKTVVNEGGYRTLAQLFQYCGLTPQSRKRKGETVKFNPEARKRLYIIAVANIKNLRSPYRAVYDEWRERYQDRVDENGKPWPKARQHAAAIRKMERKILIDLYLEAKRLHDEQTNV